VAAETGSGAWGIIGAVLEGPLVGLGIGLIFGVFSMIQAAVAPTGPTDVWFTNPLLSVLPRLLIGPVAWLVWTALKRWPVAGLIGAGIAGSLTNTIAVLGMIGLLGYVPWAALPAIVVANGLPEAGAAAIITLVVAQPGSGSHRQTDRHNICSARIATLTAALTDSQRVFPGNASCIMEGRRRV
jgi:hypothetical protein